MYIATKLIYNPSTEDYDVLDEYEVEHIMKDIKLDTMYPAGKRAGLPIMVVFDIL